MTPEQSSLVSLRLMNHSLEELQKGREAGGTADAENKSLVVGAIEVLVFEDSKGKRRERAGRLRLQLIQNANQENLGTFLSQNVETNSKVRTDGWKGYSETALMEYIHHVRVAKLLGRICF